MKPDLKNLVCIDDDKAILEINRAILEATGNYQVSCFSNGFDGVQHAKTHQVDLILLDMEMPVMNGLAVIRVLKDDPMTRDVPVIFMTGRKTPEDVQKYMAQGAVSVITKPIDIEDFPYQMQLLSGNS